MNKVYFSRIAALAACSIPVFSAAAVEMRVFRSADGQAVKASFEELEGGSVTLKREDGKLFDLPLDLLSAADQTYVQETARKIADAVGKLNQAAGHGIVSGKPFAELKAEDIAKTLGVHPESQSKYGKSWRLYAARAKDYQLFGTMPYSVALYADKDGFVSSMSIVYANKGDFGSTAGFGQDHFSGGNTATAKSLGEAMTRDEETVAKALTSVLGEGKTQRYGEGGTRRKITRWDWNGYAFLLSNEENEYVSLGIVSTDMANAGGRSTRVTDAEIRQRIASSVVKEKNGDIYLSEIPMVDQGPKGYCVPATFERAMRTMGLEADMYLLAMVGESSAGGGTSVPKLMENVKSQVVSKGRRIKEDSLKELRIRDFKRYIDSGIPVMWTMCSVSEYNKVTDKNTEVRKTVTDWSAHAKTIAAENAAFGKTAKPESNYHICMIIGYNEETQEIAVSDSWGQRFERRWVPIATANWVSGGALFMILP